MTRPPLWLGKPVNENMTGYLCAQISVRYKNGLVAHRVLCIAGPFVTLAGDNCSRPDVPIPLENLYGVVLLVRRRGRVLRRPEWDRGPTALGLLRRRLKQSARRLRMAVK